MGEGRLAQRVHEMRRGVRMTKEREIQRRRSEAVPRATGPAEEQDSRARAKERGGRDTSDSRLAHCCTLI